MCLAIKTFHDGDRLIISIDGLPHQSSEDIAKVFLAGILSNTQAVADSTATPVFPEKEKVPETNIFQDGPFKGITPEAAMGRSEDLREQDKVCVQFSAMLDHVDAGLKQAICKEARAYLQKRFKECDENTYGERLSEAQLLFFYTRYVPFITKDMRQYLLKKYKQPNWNAFLFQDTEILREAVSLIIKSFK